MGKKAVFLDRDGTINVDTNYLFKIEDFVFLPGAVDALRRLERAGYQLIVVTNQSGIARGFFAESDYLRLNAWMTAELQKQGVHIAASYHCPHHPEAVVPEYRMDCECRKPKTGLFFKAAQELGVDFSQSWAIGDRPRDLSICGESGARGVLLYSKNEGREGSVWKINGGLDGAAQKIISGAFE